MSWKGLNRTGTYHNPYDVWAKHPDAPALLLTASQTGGIGDSRLWLLREPNRGKPKARRFATFTEARDWAAGHLGITGWAYVHVNRMGCWLPDPDSPDAAACEVSISHDWSHTPCGRPVVGQVVDWGNPAPACKLHVAREQRRNERHANWEREWREECIQRDRDAELRSASDEWARRLADEFGVHAHGMDPNDGRLGVEVEPEHLYGILVDMTGQLRDAGLDYQEITR